MKVRLNEAIEDYRRFRISQGMAAQTLKNDKQTLIAFLTHVGNIYVENIEDYHVTRFLESRTKTRGNGSLAIDQQVIRGFCKWAAHTKRAPKTFDPTQGLRAPKRQERERDRIHVSKFPYLLDVAGRRSPRDRMFIAMGLYTMARDSEITTVRIRDVDLDSGHVLLRIHKAKKEDWFPISSELDAELRRWLTFYSSQVGELLPDYYLTPARSLIIQPGVSPSNRDTKLQPTRRITHSGPLIVKPALHAIGFTTEADDLHGEGAHTLRRSGARALFDALKGQGYDHAMRLVQAALHHKSISTTEHYIGLTADRKERDKVLLGQSMFGLPELPTIGVADGGSAGLSEVV